LFNWHKRILKISMKVGIWRRGATIKSDNKEK
jgi:hypothetical protein